jgi:endonuclease YncB( thermonuclease family)
MYEYKATVIEVHDGDTCYLDVDLGFTTHTYQHVRLAHVNAPELHEANGERAKERLAELLADGPLIINTTRDRREKYGRMLATITNASGIDVGSQLLVEKLAVKYEGGRR